MISFSGASPRSWEKEGASWLPLCQKNLRIPKSALLLKGTPAWPKEANQPLPEEKTAMKSACDKLKFITTAGLHDSHLDEV